jgi:hypothetical protein
MDNVHAGYLQDLGVLLRERALEARRQAISSRNADPREFAFDIGYLQAYQHVISLMINQARTFD